MINMRLKMSLDLRIYDEIKSDHIFFFNDFNNEDLASLFYRAYHHSVDDEGESIKDWISNIIDFKEHKYGELIDEASFVMMENDQMVSAIVIGLKDSNPYIISLVPDPMFRQRGYASKLIKACASVLKTNYKELILYVSKENKDAINLYNKFGF